MTRASPPYPRHSLVWVRPDAWRAVMASRPDLAALPRVEHWALQGYPLIVRRYGHEDAQATDDRVPLGLPLPPADGKQRLFLSMSRADIVTQGPCPLLQDVLDVAPAAWLPSLRRVLHCAQAHAAEVRVFGSLAWQHLTGLPYLSPHSDVDLLWRLTANSKQIRQWLDELAMLDAAAPMRLDGELLRADGAGVNWRELQGGAATVLLKATHEARLLTPMEFFRTGHDCAAIA